MESTDKEAYTDATFAQEMRNKFRARVEGAVNCAHVSRNWANTWLVRLGITPITGQAEYRMNTAITGDYGWRCKAGSRAEAEARFKEQVARVAAAGKITADGSYDNVYNVEFTGGPVVFYSGPEDPATGDTEFETLELVGAGIQQMLKEGVRTQGWGYSYANAALAELGLPVLPAMVHRAVEVPVTGTHRLNIPVFEDDDDEAVQKAVAGRMARAGVIGIEPDELGDVKVTRPAEADGDDPAEDYGDDPF